MDVFREFTDQCLDDLHRMFPHGEPQIRATFSERGTEWTIKVRGNPGDWWVAPSLIGVMAQVRTERRKGE